MTGEYPSNEIPSTAFATHRKYAEPVATGYSLDEIAQLAESIGEQLGYKPGEEIEPVVERLGGAFRYLDTDEYFFQDGCERLIVDGPGKFTISLHKLGGLFNNRFAIAHELGHYFLHSEMGKTPLHATNDGSVTAEEWEATVFAAAFLMPRQRVIALRDRALSIYDLSASFLVSPEAVTRWCRMLTPAQPE